MVLHLFSGYSASAFQTTPSKTDAGEETKVMRVPDDVSHAFEVEDDDGQLSGSGASITQSGDTSQSASVYENDTLSSSGTIYVNRVVTFEDGSGNSHTAYLLRIEETGESFYVFEDPPPAGGTEMAVVSSVAAPDGGVAYETLSGNDLRDSDTRATPDDENIAAGAGNDGLATRDGDDTVDAGAGNDTVFAGDGDDSISGGEGADSVEGGEGRDTISGGEGNDTLRGGEDGDSIDGGDGIDILYGGDGDDTLSGNADTDYILGDAGNDQIFGGDGHDAATGGADNDTLWGGAGDDTLYGGEGNDFVLGDGSASTDGDDILYGEAGDDTLYGYGGDDVMSGGTGSDYFLVGTGHDTITDFDTTDSDDGDIFNNDYINLASYYDHLSELRADQADDGILNQSNTLDAKGNAVDYSDNARFTDSSLTVQGASASSYSEENTGVRCFTKGTLILTPDGERPVEDLAVGDLVVTKDNGPQPIRCSLRSTISGAKIAENQQPILLQRGSLGPCLPRRDLVVSGQHRIHLDWSAVSECHQTAEVLAPAKGLTKMPGIRRKRGVRAVEYIHLLMDRHEILFAEGAPTESFYPGPTAMRDMSEKNKAALFIACPALRVGVLSALGKPARKLLRVEETKALVQHHKRQLKQDIAAWDFDRETELRSAQRRARKGAPIGRPASKLAS